MLYPSVYYSNKLWIFIHIRVQEVSLMGNIWIGPWAIYPHYMDPTLYEVEGMTSSSLHCIGISCHSL